MANKQDRPLTAKQQLFIEAYTDNTNTKTFANGLQSASKAGYKGNNRQLAVQAAQNLIKPNIKTAIMDITAKRAAKAEYNQQIAHGLLMHQYTKADNNGDVMAAVACIREDNSIHGLKTDNINLRANTEPDKLSDEELQTLRRMAIATTNTRPPGTESKLA